MTNINEMQLLANALIASKQQKFSSIVKSAEEARISIFLSHSHKDRVYVQGFIFMLDQLGYSIYVDWQDKDMPRVTSVDTANRIKISIRECNKFLVLATNNALNSRWVPWELGIADSLKNYEDIAIVPVDDVGGSFEGSEYINIYQRVIFSEGKRLAVFKKAAITGQRLNSWLLS